MEKKRPVLFVGNGIAQRIRIAEKWDKIINDTAKRYGINISPDILKKLPYNMQIVAASNDNVDKAMIGLSERLKSITLNDEQKAFTKRVLELPFTDILTTNYTYELERSVSDNKTFRCRYPADHKHRATDMTLFGHIPISVDGTEKKIWHIHGHACAPNSVIMGHYFYGKLISRIQSYIHQMLKGWRAAEKNGGDFEIRSWVDCFMTCDVYMVGFGMDLCEADIWWLACCKKRHFPDRKIYYYVPAWEMSADDPKRILMNAYGIVIREIHCQNNDYSEFYEKTLKELSELSEE